MAEEKQNDKKLTDLEKAMIRLYDDFLDILGSEDAFLNILEPEEIISIHKLKERQKLENKGKE